MRALFDYRYRSDCRSRTGSNGWYPGRQAQRQHMGQHQSEGVERPRLFVVVIVVRFDVHSGFGVRGCMRGKEVRMNLPEVSVIAIRTGVNVLKPRDAECQQ